MRNDYREIWIVQMGRSWEVTVLCGRGFGRLCFLGLPWWCQPLLLRWSVLPGQGKVCGRSMVGRGGSRDRQKNVRLVLPRSKTSGAVRCVLILVFSDNTASMLCTIIMYSYPDHQWSSSSLSRRIHILLLPSIHPISMSTSHTMTGD